MNKENTTHVLVTGAAGFIGFAVVQELLSHDIQVSVLLHRNVPDKLTALAASEKVKIYRGSISEKEQLFESLDNCGHLDAIIHCAGRASDVGRDIEFRHTNLTGVKNTVKWVKSQSSTTKLIHISTTDVYGIKDFNHADEHTPYDNNLNNPYPKYKIMAEQYIASNLSPARYTILRPAAVWGPGDTTLTPRIVDFLKSSPWIIHFGAHHGENRWPLAHISHLTTAVHLAVTDHSTNGETYNVIDPDLTSIDDFYRAVLEIYLPKKQCRSLTLPFWVGVFIGHTSTTLSNLLNRYHPIFEPTIYGLHSVSTHLDFSHNKLHELFAKHHKTMQPFRQLLKTIHGQTKV